MKQPEQIKHAVSRNETQRLWQERTGVESFLREMRNHGARQVESMIALRELGGYPLGEAKKTVHFSQTWADMRQATEALHENAYKALEQWAEEGSLKHVAG